MAVSTLSAERLIRGPGVRNGEQRPRGSHGRYSVPPGWTLERSPTGRLTLRRPHAGSGALSPLTLHAAWAGPIKLAQCGEGFEQRIELFLGAAMTGGVDPLLDEETAGVLDDLTQSLIDGQCRQANRTCANDWQPPSAEHCAQWLQLAGCETAIDKDQNLRLTLKRRGCDGQVRLERAAGRMRFVLPLGRWRNLPPAAARAIQSQAQQLNDRSRLLRIAWIVESESSRCEAQIDLSGLPAPTDAAAPVETLWREMTRLAVGGLELALRQLGLELPLLADEAQGDLVNAMSQVSGVGSQESGNKPILISDPRR